MNRFSMLVLLLWPLLLAERVRAEPRVQSQEIKYAAGGVTCRGYLAWDAQSEHKRPGVLVVHEWWGLNDYTRRRADQLAALGYVAFACDMYGDGRKTEHPQEAGQFAAEVRENVEEWRRRAAAGLDVLKSQPPCDPERLAAIGYCFGGSTALQLAYGGADLDAVVTFHAALPVPSAEDAARIRGRILINHGAQDTFIPEAGIQQFRTALDAAGVDWSMIYYAGAVHGFTVADADRRGMAGLKYDARADERSWRAMLEVFREGGLE
jgi:dienelactone hydrolase